jgi:hypothetical protein
MNFGHVEMLEMLGHLKHPSEISYIENWLHSREIWRHITITRLYMEEVEREEGEQEKESRSYKQTNDSALRIHG